MSELNLSITEQLAYSTIRIVCELENGATSTGTGYFYNFCFNSQNKRHIPALVTNKHVVENANKGVLIFSTQKDGKPIVGEHFKMIVNDFSNWIMHPEDKVDLCVLPIAPIVEKIIEYGRTPYYISIRDDIIPSQAEIDEFTAMEDIIMIGYPNGIWDSTNNQPVFRKGITATHPAKDYEGRSEFMIDAACFPGSSGSPVFLLNLGGYQTRKGHVLGKGRIKLLGTLYAGPQFTAQGEIKVQKIPTQNRYLSLTNIPNNLGYVIKSSTLKDFEPILCNGNS